MNKHSNSLANLLNQFIDENEETEIPISQLIEKLAGKGQALIVMLFSLPFCLPIQIPGLSTPFGILLIFVGIRISFGHSIWLPNFLIQKKIAKETLKKIAKAIIKVTDKLKFLIWMRLVWLVKNPILHMFHGIVIAFLSLFLALPLPIPFTNLFVSFPLFFFGLALLEDDGILILFAYLLTILGLIGLFAIFWFGKESLSLLF